jgi:arsenate reductase
MAEAFLRFLDSRIEVHSAGTRPAQRVHPLAVKVMSEVGIDLSECRPKSVSRFLDRDFDYVITVCDGARDECPVFTGNVRHRLHFGFDDPARAAGTDDEVLATFRRVRDEIRDKVRDLCREHLRGWPGFHHHPVFLPAHEL